MSSVQMPQFLPLRSNALVKLPLSISLLCWQTPCCLYSQWLIAPASTGATDSLSCYGLKKKIWQQQCGRSQLTRQGCWDKAESECGGGVKKWRRIKWWLPEGKGRVLHVAFGMDPSRCPQELLRPRVCSGNGFIAETHFSTQHAASIFNRCPVRTRRQLHSRPLCLNWAKLTGCAWTGISSQVNPCVMQNSLCRATNQWYGADLKYTTEARGEKKVSLLF